jgi:hypothetical protein
MTSYEIIVYAPGAPPRTVHLGTSEADMHSHLNAVEGTLQATCATAHIEIRTGRRSRWNLLPPGRAHRVCATRVGGERMKFHRRGVLGAQPLRDSRAELED